MGGLKEELLIELNILLKMVLETPARLTGNTAEKSKDVLTAIE